MPGAIQVVLNRTPRLSRLLRLSVFDSRTAGDTVFYNSNILHW